MSLNSIKKEISLFVAGRANIPTTKSDKKYTKMLTISILSGGMQQCGLKFQKIVSDEGSFYSNLHSLIYKYT